MSTSVVIHEQWRAAAPLKICKHRKPVQIAYSSMNITETGIHKTNESAARARRCDEQETLSHVLGFCHHGELLRINRHNTVRSLIAASIRQNASYEVYEEVGCVSSDGSTRRADIIIIDRQKDKGVILDPTIRFEMHEQQPQEMCREKQVILRCFIDILGYLGEGDNAGEMSPGSNTESYPAFAQIGLRENPGKNLNQVTYPDRESNPGHLVSRPDALTVTPQKRVINNGCEDHRANHTIPPLWMDIFFFSFYGGAGRLVPQPETYCAYLSCSVNDVCRRTIAFLYEYITLHRELNPSYGMDD
ncbi:hypothetical protein ANN_19709 [Periplaneta americana]|uniref:Uncharacterized protein n=1 Tax=Periplaneta americana TaxID=6978 RepID=A0ABQ8SAM4_PERAM|nr:hypothetical protein ANN_19709 [Periplaneta americana]